MFLGGRSWGGDWSLILHFAGRDGFFWEMTDFISRKWRVLFPGGDGIFLESDGFYFLAWRIFSGKTLENPRKTFYSKTLEKTLENLEKHGQTLQNPRKNLRKPWKTLENPEKNLRKNPTKP